METDGWIQVGRAMKINFDQGALDVTPEGQGFRVTLGDRSAYVETEPGESGQLDLLIDGRRVTAHVSLDGAKRWVTIDGRTAMLTKSSSARRRSARHEGQGSLTAPMPGQVRSVSVRTGDHVKKGQTLLVLEAMKMEMRIQAPADAQVRAVHVEPGQSVEREQILIEVEE